MATAEQVKALLKCYREGNGEHFVSIALQIAAHAARSGKGQLAQELRGLIDDIKQKQSPGRLVEAMPFVHPPGNLASLLAVTYPKTRLSEMVLSSGTRAKLERAIREYHHLGKLREYGVSARRKLLLIGPPGCGKTMTASALAGELKLPLFSVQFHGLITRFMGETAAKLSLIFRAMTHTCGVYFFDEFDAIGADRGIQNDVGEIRRVLNSFLQFLEQDDSDSLIIAATNYTAILDEALFRRFDDVIRYERPSEPQITELIRNRLHLHLVKRPVWKTIREAAVGLSYAEIAHACDDALKDCILGKAEYISTAMLTAALKERRPLEFIRPASGRGDN